MVRTYFDVPASEWEPLEGDAPIGLLDQHPSRQYVALQVIVLHDTFVWRAAIWNTTTKTIVWNPGDANALCWLPGGHELLVVREIFTPHPERRGIFLTPLQAEFRHLIERRTWPEQRLIDTIDVSFPTGWLVDVIVSPVAPLACFVWNDQCEAGIEFVSWTDGSFQQLHNRGYYGNSNLLEGPVFSPDGAVVVFSYGTYGWWSEDPELPSQGGTFRVGWIVIYNVAHGSYREVDVLATIPVGWLPEDLERIYHNGAVSCPRFSTPERFSVTLPTGEQQSFLINPGDR